MSTGELLSVGQGCPQVEGRQTPLNGKSLFENGPRQIKVIDSRTNQLAREIDLQTDDCRQPVVIDLSKKGEVGPHASAEVFDCRKNRKADFKYQAGERVLNIIVQVSRYEFKVLQISATCLGIGDLQSDRAKAELYGKVKDTKWYQRAGAYTRSSEALIILGIFINAGLGSPIDASIISSVGRSTGEGGSQWFQASAGESTADQTKAQRGVEKTSGEKQTINQAERGNADTLSRLKQALAQMYSTGQ